MERLNRPVPELLRLQTAEPVRRQLPHSKRSTRLVLAVDNSSDLSRRIININRRSTQIKDPLLRPKIKHPLLSRRLLNNSRPGNPPRSPALEIATAVSPLLPQTPGLTLSPSLSRSSLGLPLKLVPNLSLLHLTPGLASLLLGHLTSQPRNLRRRVTPANLLVLLQPATLNLSPANLLDLSLADSLSLSPADSLSLRGAPIRLRPNLVLHRGTKLRRSCPLGGMHGRGHAFSSDCGIGSRCGLGRLLARLLGGKVSGNILNPLTVDPAATHPLPLNRRSLNHWLVGQRGLNNRYFGCRRIHLKLVRRPEHTVNHRLVQHPTPKASLYLRRQLNIPLRRLGEIPGLLKAARPVGFAPECTLTFRPTLGPNLEDRRGLGAVPGLRLEAVASLWVHAELGLERVV